MNLDGSGPAAVAAAKMSANRKTSASSLTFRIVLLIVAWVAAGFYFRTSSQAYRALRSAEDTTPESLNNALRLEPSNAEFHYRIGRYSLLAQDLRSAIADFNAAIALNPYDARFWLDLANAKLANDDRPAAEQALGRAMEVDPTTPEVVWQTANYELVQGNTEVALRRFHDLVEHDPEALLEVMNVCWRGTRDSELIAEKVLPPRADAHFDLVRFLSSRHEPEAADKVWSHLVAIKLPFSVQSAFPYFDYLISRGEFVQAADAWAQAAIANPELRPYVPGDDRMVNGGFELDLLNGGFDWRYVPKAGISAVIDVNRAHSGKRSLGISFTGTPDDVGVFQFVPVRGNTRYEFSGYMMAEDLESVSRPRFSVIGLRGNKSYVLTDGVSNSRDWQQFQDEFTTGPEDDLLLVRIARSPSQRLIRGEVWVDDVKLVPKSRIGDLP